MHNQLQPAVFLDKDGTLVPDLPFNVDPQLMMLLPGVASELQSLQQAGFKLVVITNQSGVAKGFFPESALREVQTQLETLLAQAGVVLDGFYYCPHDQHGVIRQYSHRCSCHKPQPGLLLRAAEELQLNLKASWMVGDRLHDLQAGLAAGCRSLGVNVKPPLSPAFVSHPSIYLVSNMSEIANVIKENSVAGTARQGKGYSYV